ncbi:hypothetical protein HNY73_002892 [Argiope bruennichi]|uniref:DUF5641 domain-containing protein n=1 Tax=Argiope bruennichi TaxID=94029 RepID=A0A8T0FXT1_ARGBR|nr:hypothetical protein HNY73_002892 [Argiope bruennichi]
MFRLKECGLFVQKRYYYSSIVAVLEYKRETFSEEEKLNLRTVKDSESLLRLETRIISRKDLEAFRFPVLLPHKHQMVEKLIMSKHIELEHACTQTDVLPQRSFLDEQKDRARSYKKVHLVQKIFSSSIRSHLDMIDSKVLNKTYAYRLKLRQDLRNHFRNEYLRILKDYSKAKEKSSIKEGDLVLIGDTNNKRINWSLAKMTMMYKGKDGRVRVVELKTQFGNIMRPIQKIYPLELNTGDSLSSTAREVKDGSSLYKDKISADRDIHRSRYGRLLKQTKRLE